MINSDSFCVLKFSKKKGFIKIWPCLCDFNSVLALAQPFYNQLASPLDMWLMKFVASRAI